MVRYRLTGVTAGPAGAQWERKDDDREIARRVLNMLGDRRMLWRDFSLEIEEHCVQSANIARQKLGELMDNPEGSSTMAQRLQAIQRHFRDFVDEVGPSEQQWDRHRSPYGTDPLSVALGRLRGLVGVHIGELAAEHDLDVSEELASIVPDQAGWFFERFEA
ncbi:hypothetical protein BCF74_10356 [Knoellia remsis]|uniref:Uncharacterized protein n=2 Tax=Knoellia remsis TaxID=407159 RepID=A0A2T0UY40_9MICO|nr:hypothetical protein BCF74_10356 [Knoellia remsis]